jgi:bifunctional polynucleotide phosphatase/kinase
MSDYIILNKTSIPSKCSIAGFDIDYTIIQTKSGNKFPKYKDDWKYLYPKDIILNKLAKFKQTHQIVFFTNQKKCNDDWIEKIENIINDLELDIPIFIGIKKNYYRKPFTGLWDLLAIDTKINLETSFYCGDAAGRPTDFAATDKMFAHNIGITFYTPEMIFENNSEMIFENNSANNYLEPYYMENPKAQINDFQSFQLDDKQQKLLVLMIGYPGSGKSTIAKTLNRLFNYQIISRDYLKTKCAKYTTNYMKQNINIIIDATNYNKSNRKPYIKLAKQFGYRVITLTINNSIQACFYMNQYRHQHSKGIYPLIPKIAYYKIRKNFEEPHTSEGIDKLFNMTNYLDIQPNLYKFETI